jgi:hypothetical protein
VHEAMRYALFRQGMLDLLRKSGEFPYEQ